MAKAKEIYFILPRALNENLKTKKVLYIKTDNYGINELHYVK